jgi:hypothetical protein
LASWHPYEDWDDLVATEGRTFRSVPQLYDRAMKKKERTRPDLYMVENKAQWAEVIDAYLDPRMVDRMFKPFDPRTGVAVPTDNFGNPLVEGARVLGPVTHGILKWTYRGHGDPSASQANFAALIGHLEPFYDEENDVTVMHVIYDWMHVWKPADYDDHQIPYHAIVDELAERISKFTELSVFSYDQYGSFVTVADLKRKLRAIGHPARVREKTFTAPEVKRMFERFKSAVGLGWVHSYKDTFGDEGVSLLELELKFLQEKKTSGDTTKIVKQDIGPVTTKDLADCAVVVASELLKDQIDRAFYRDTLGKTKIRPAAQGGYHTGGDEPVRPQPRSRNAGARAQLERQGKMRAVRGRAYRG